MCTTVALATFDVEAPNGEIVVHNWPRQRVAVRRRYIKCRPRRFTTPGTGKKDGAYNYGGHGVEPYTWLTARRQVQ